MDSDPFSDPRIQGVINALCAIYRITPEELVKSVRGERRGGDGEHQTIAVPGLPASGEGEQS